MVKQIEKSGTDGLERIIESNEEKAAIEIVTRQVILLQEPEPRYLKKIFYKSLSEPYDDRFYKLLAYSQKKCNATGKTRRCKNPISVHATYGVTLRIKQYTRLSNHEQTVEHPEIETILALGAIHDLREDCPVPRKKLRRYLESICIQHIDDLLELTDLLTKKGKRRRAIEHILRPFSPIFTPIKEYVERKPVFKEEEYGEYVNRIFEDAYKRFEAKSILYDAGVIVKLADAIDNIETSPQITADFESYTKTLIKTQKIKRRAEEFAEKTGNPFVASLLDRLGESEVTMKLYMEKTVHGGVDEILEYASIKSNTAPDLPARYQGTITSAFKALATLREIGRNSK